MIELLLVFLGGGIGAGLRYLITLGLNQKKIDMKYWATFVINVVGCLFLGFILTFLVKTNIPFAKTLKLFLATGIAGGFTTFSTYNYENYVLIKEGKILKSLFYIFMSLFFGICAIFLGIYVAKGLY